MSWHKDNPTTALLARILDRPLAFHRALVDIPVIINGKRTRLGVLAALMLSQAIYWQVRVNEKDEEGWFYKPRWEWEQETGLSRREQETARKRLRQTSFWHEEMRGFPKRLHYHVDLAALEQALYKLVLEETEPSSETDLPVGTNAPNREETDLPVGTNAPNRGETDLPVGTNAPNRRPSVGTDPPSQLVQMRPSVGTDPPNRKGGALNELINKDYSKDYLRDYNNNNNSDPNTKDSRPKAPVVAVAVAAAADNPIPEQIAQALKDLGWVGSMAEIAHAWRDDPERVQAWLDHARRKGWSAALFRATLRQDPGYPPDPEEARRRSYFQSSTADLEDEYEDPGSETAQPPPLLAVEGDAPPEPEEVARWWENVREQVRLSMPPAAFEKHVKPLRPLSYRNGERGHLTLSSPEEYSRDWLNDRLKRTLERLLVGYVHKPVVVEFVVEQNTDPHNPDWAT